MTRFPPIAFACFVVALCARAQEESPGMMLGPVDQKLGAYLHSAPTGWTGQKPRDSNLAMMYRSPDKSGVLLVQVKPNAGAPIEMQGKYAQETIQMLKQGFVKNKTEVVAQPAVVKDPRFFLKVQEKFKTKPDTAANPPAPAKTATQTHIYRVEGKDMIVLTAISTSEKQEEAAGVQKLAEEMAMAFTPQKQ
jgi:hypothetical protein